MLLCRSWFLLHRGMGDPLSPMSCLIICLDAVIIPRFSRFDKCFFFDRNYFFWETAQPLRHASRASSPERGAFLDAAPHVHLLRQKIFIEILAGMWYTN